MTKERDSEKMNRKKVIKTTCTVGLIMGLAASLFVVGKKNKILEKEVVDLSARVGELSRANHILSRRLNEAFYHLGKGKAESHYVN